MKTTTQPDDGFRTTSRFYARAQPANDGLRRRAERDADRKKIEAINAVARAAWPRKDIYP